MSLQQFIIGELPQTADLPVYKGDDVEIPLVMEEGEAPNYTPIDITGSTFKMRIEKKRGATEVLTITTAGGGIPITDAANGEFKIVLSAANTTTIYNAEAPLQYDLQWTKAGGKVKTLLRGDVKTVKDRTPA